MKFQMPETLEGLTLAEVSDLYDKALAEANALNAIADDAITAEETNELIELVGHIDVLSARKDEIGADEAAAAEALAAARGRMADLSTPAPEGDEEGEEEGEEEAEAAAEEKELVTASGSRQSFASKVAARTPAPSAPVEEEKPAGALAIIASANVPGFNSGQTLNNLDELAKAFIGRGKSFVSGGKQGKAVEMRSPGRYNLSPNAQRFSVAKLEKPETEFVITEKMSAEDQFDLIQKVAQESRLPGGSLLAAGGWCAPSEQVWSFCELETMSGLLSIPEMVARRGGVTWTPGPQLSDLLSDPDFGWIGTEAEFEDGVPDGEDGFDPFVKPCYEISCPDWDEVRLDAIGFCIRAGLLTNAAYPELVRRVLALGLIAHARTVNANTISRISTLIGAATVFTSVTGTNYSATADLLTAIELNATRVRETHAMDVNATLEAIFPIWAPMVIRSELARRNGVDLLNVTNQQINAWFATRGIAAQFVRDYQSINSGATSTAGGTADWTDLPNSLEFMVYPAGAYVRLGTDVIDLDAVYDADSLSGNQYTAAFFEEGFGILNACGAGVKVQVSIANLNGATGYPAIGAGEGTSIPVVEAG